MRESSVCLQSGNNDMVEWIDRSRSNAEKYQLREKLFGTEEVILMWVADMDLSTPPCVLEAVHKRLNHPILGYEIMSDEAYHAQIGWVKNHHGWEMKREWMSYSPSVVASIGCAIRALSEKGDEVIVMDPVYPPFFHMVKNNGRRLVIHPLKQDEEGVYRFSLERLQAQITSKTKILLLCSPHNPLGRVWNEDELRSLAELCLAHGIRIISDEIHSDLIYEPHRHTCLASLGDDVRENTITLMGPGKTFNMAGFSISTVIIPSEKLRHAYLREQQKLHWGEGAVLSHIAFETAYLQGQDWYAEVMDQLARNRAMIGEWIEDQERVNCVLPEATYLAWIDCRALGLGDRELREFFIHKAGLGLSPGLSFGKEGSGFMRLNFAVSSEILERALNQFHRALHG